MAYFCGEWQPLADTKVSVLDRGFLFADGVYEHIPVYYGTGLRLDEHLKRLEYSLSQLDIRLASPLPWGKIIEEVLNKNQAFGEHQKVYLQITRGAEDSRCHTYKGNSEPTLLIYSAPLHIPTMEELTQPKSAITAPDWRWGRCDIKSISLLPNILASQQAKQAGAVEAILLRDGIITEGASSNVFILKNNVLMTPRLGAEILGGVTRHIVMDLAKKHQIPCHETDITAVELRDADELWITSSTRTIYPISVLDDNPIGTQAAGPIWQILIADYLKMLGQ